MKMLDITPDDTDYNSQQHFSSKKRRDSSTTLVENNMFDPTDINLQKKLNRMEALLVLKFGSPDHP